ncbi:MAG: putative beta-lysine N-acetyltransferase, partial [Candidatus Methanomethylophilaceae archaeon]
LMKSSKEARNEALPQLLLDLAEEHDRGKVLAKVPLSLKKAFLDHGYVIEARVRGLFGREDGIFVAFYRDVGRDTVLSDAEVSILHRCVDQEPDPCTDGQDVVEMTEAQASSISALMSEVFPGYPFPVHDPAFVEESMRHGTRYFGVMEEDDLLSVASAECDSDHRCAELTDMATKEDRQGQGLSSKVLCHMQGRLKADGYRRVYTIARSCSPAVNAIFAKQGFFYAGTLRSNTYFGDRLENMNVWHRRL